jgi:hypothetical protein
MDINNCIDLCVINNTDYDISFVVFKILEGKYRYISNNAWEYLDKNNSWVSDIKQNNFKYSIKTEVYTYFIKRAIELCDKEGDKNIISGKLLDISSKLKEDKYISTIIKESRQFFINE